MGIDRTTGLASSSKSKYAAETSPFVDLLGAELLSGSKSKVSTDEALAGKAKVALYFSAHWCPPCRRFTPILAEFYRKAGGLEADTAVVFVSSDRDSASFASYFGSMPWLAVPFDKRELKAELGTKFGVRGIPTLVVLDGATGELVTTEGRAEVDTLFPPRAAAPSHALRGARLASPPSPFEDLLGGELLCGKSKVRTAEALAGKGQVALYFSAHWCPPCRGFTPVLASKYVSAGGNGEANDTAVVFVSSDQDARAFASYFGSMPWLALPFDKRKLKAELCEKFGVRGIPSLVVLDAATGALVTKEGRAKVDTIFKPAQGSAKKSVCSGCVIA